MDERSDSDEMGDVMSLAGADSGVCDRWCGYCSEALLVGLVVEVGEVLLEVCRLMLRVIMSSARASASLDALASLSPSGGRAV